MSILKDPDVYERFARVILVHGVRWTKETAVAEQFISELRQHEILGRFATEQLDYYPAITREPHANQGRLTRILASGKLFRDLSLPPLAPKTDRLMACGSRGGAGILDTGIKWILSRV